MSMVTVGYLRQYGMYVDLMHEMIIIWKVVYIFEHKQPRYIVNIGHSIEQYGVSKSLFLQLSDCV